MESISVVPITARDLEAHLEVATGQVFQVQLRPPRAAGGEAAAAPAAAALGGRSFTFRPLLALDGGGAAGSTAPRKFSLIEAIRDVESRDTLFSDTEHHVLGVVRRSLQLYLCMFDRFQQASGLDRLQATNGAGKLAREQEAELARKLESACAVSLFSAACFLLRKLARHRSDEVEALEVEVAAPLPLALDSRKGASEFFLWYLVDSIQRGARDDVGLVKVVLEAARHVCERIRGMQGSLQGLEVFLRHHYRVEGDDITLAGFETAVAPALTVVEVQAKRPEEVVGNHIAKFEAQRLAQRLVCYDMARQRNPFVDLGGFSFTVIGDGSPGTGKTTLIQMTVTQLAEYCQQLGLPFRYLNFSVDEISDYQGRSGQNAKRFCRTLLDPRAIGFGTIDDVDQVCGNRNDRNASAGQLEVTAVFMSEFAGPATVVRGNTTFGLFSNYPEKVDDALRQRTQARFLVDGPQTLEDFTDLMVLQLGEVIQMENGLGYTPFASQQIREVIRAKYAEHDRPASPELARIFETCAKGGAVSTWIEFGRYLKALQENDPRFTGRAVKNIADAVRFRMMDFDLPPEWFERKELFFGQAYETKVAMLRELRGEVTPRIILQEVNRYADSEARYANADEERQLADRTRQLVLDAQARVHASEKLSR